jgi:hypothetical protein
MEQMEQRIGQLLEEHVEEDKDGKGEGSSGTSNRKKQIEKLKKKAERIEEFVKDKNPKIGKQGRDIQSNITDNESCKMKSSHGIIQGYNGQALVDNKHQVILHAEAFGDA